MKYINEFRNPGLARKLSLKIKEIMPRGQANIMEVCGTHTHNFYRFGLDRLLPGQLNFVSGPGCPVCVSSREYIDQAIKYSRIKNTIIVSFGDMLKVKGAESSLLQMRAEGSQIRIAYSALDALEVARENPGKKVVFLAVGFETTAPTIALSIIRAQREKIKNLLFFSSLKLIPPAMEYLAADPRLKIHAFLCPGHVSVIIGSRAYEAIVRKRELPCCVGGFEPLDILEAVYLLLLQIKNKKAQVDNQYARVVTHSGNFQAQRLISEVFQKEDCLWRGLGKIAQSGLRIKKKFIAFDAEETLGTSSPQPAKGIEKKCLCGEVLKGLARPSDCILFRKQCTPLNPVGPCMVSSEGACNAYYKYR